MNWVDIVIIAIIVIAVIKGYIDGFVMSLVNIAGVVAGIIAAKLYFKELSVFLTENTSIYHKVYQFIIHGFNESGIIENFYGNVVEAGTQNGIVGSAGIVSNIIINIMSILIIYFTVRIIFAVLTHFLNALVELPVLKQFNRLGGIAIGLAKGIIGVMILFALSLPFVQIFSIKWLTMAIEQSSTAEYFYRYNFVLTWAAKVITNVFTN